MVWQVISNGDDCISVVPTGDPASAKCVFHPEQCAGGNLLVHNVTCKGGHGLSIGSVRHGDGVLSPPSHSCSLLLCSGASCATPRATANIAACAYRIVSNVTFSSCVMTREEHSTQGIYSSGGLRIKCYPNGTGIVSNIVYKDITIHDVAYPLQLQARYCPGSQGSCPSGACRDETSAAPHSNS